MLGFSQVSNCIESYTKKRVVHRFLEYVHLETEMWYFSVAMILLTLARGLVSVFVGVAMRQLETFYGLVNSKVTVSEAQASAGGESSSQTILLFTLSPQTA